MILASGLDGGDNELMQNFGGVSSWKAGLGGRAV
jgi:hypothetical protein